MKLTRSAVLGASIAAICGTANANYVLTIVGVNVDCEEAVTVVQNTAWPNLQAFFAKSAQQGDSVGAVGMPVADVVCGGQLYTASNVVELATHVDDDMVPVYIEITRVSDDTPDSAGDIVTVDVEQHQEVTGAVEVGTRARRRYVRRISRSSRRRR